MARIYLASPYGFSEATQVFLEELKSQLRKAGHDVMDPWEMGRELMEGVGQVG